MSAISPEAVIADFERRAVRRDTPCGEGTLAWRAWGQGPPLILVHGAYGSWAHWIRNIDDLAQDHTVWAVDIPGFGDSAPPARPTVGESYGQALAEGLRRILGPGETADVVGFSTGGTMSAHMAAAGPDLVRRLILVNAGGLGTPVGRIDTLALRGLAGDELRQTHRHNLMALMFHHPETLDDLALHIQETYVPRSTVNPRPLVIPDMLLRVLPRVRAPIDAIWSELDIAHPNPAAQLAVLRTIQPQATLRVLPDVGHWVMYERPEAFNATLRDLLAAPPHQG